MHQGQRFGRWNNPINWKDIESNWRIREVATPVTTRSGINTVGLSTISSGSEEDSDPPPQMKVESDLFSGSKRAKEDMANNMEDDPEIGSPNAHLSGEPAQAIVMTPGQAGIEVKNNVLAIMPHFYGCKIDNPCEFLHKFCKLCGIQKRPSWAKFGSVFLDYFFPATQTNALKKEIQGATQEGDEMLSQYWGGFKGLLDACPNNRMTEAEIYNNFYEGLAPESKDLVNWSSGGDFWAGHQSTSARRKAYQGPSQLVDDGAAEAEKKEPEEEELEAKVDEMDTSGENPSNSAVKRAKPYPYRG
ncbi:hypothetical protein AAHA92_17463 [Salvia divinorum]|uniref:Retrotransposon gag domain-containing protein n=1 Tax=Salvia divinorum TaxID=28513 RepID=A0ABD1H1Q4_SALDI